MATNIRLRGGKTDSYTVTLNNQVGPDTATQSDRTIPSYSGNAIYVAKTGSDANAGTAEGSPKLTIQNAIDTAVSGAQAYVVIIDSGVYLENIDLKGKTLVAKDGFAPTIKAPADSIEVLHDFGQDVYSLIEWEISGTKYIIAGTANGLYRSSDGGFTFSSWVLAGKAIRDMVLHVDSGAMKLYTANTTDKYITTVDTSGTTATFKDFSTEFASLLSICSIDSVLIIGGSSNTNYSPAYYYDGSSWVNVFDLTSGIINTIKKDSSVDIQYGFCGGSVGAHIDGVKSYIFRLSSTDGAIAADPISSNKIYAASNSYIKSGDLIFGSSDNVYKIENFAAGSSEISLLASNLFSGVQYIDGAISLFIDRDGRYYIGQGIGVNALISHDMGGTWRDIQTNTTSSVVDFIEHKGRIVIADSYSSGSSTLRIEKSNIISTVGDGIANGVIIDGDNNYQGTNACINDVNTQWCKMKNSGIGQDDGESSNSIIENCAQPTSSDNYCDSMTNCIIYNSGDCIYVDDFQHNTIYSIGNGIKYTTASQVVKDNIFWQAGTPFDFDRAISEDSDYDYNLYIQPSGAASVEMFSTQYTNNPLFQNENTGNFKLQSKAEGYGIDSLYLKGGSNQSSDNKDMGAWDITRTLSGTTYTDDYTLGINPTAVNVEYRTPNYSTATNANGEVSEWATDRDGHIRRTFLLPYSDVSVNGNWYRQIHDLVYLYGQVGNVYEFGYTDDGGSTWKAMRSGTGTVSGSDISVTYNGEEWAVDKWAGYWILIDGTHYRITSSTAKTDTGSCTFTVDGTPTTGSQAWQIDFILVTLNKKSPLAPKYATYTAEDDYVQEVAAIGYTITLNEVDDYDI